jgi:hypothetical protein
MIVGCPTACMDKWKFSRIYCTDKNEQVSQYQILPALTEQAKFQILLQFMAFLTGIIFG